MSRSTEVPNSLPLGPIRLLTLGTRDRRAGGWSAALAVLLFLAASSGPAAAQEHPFGSRLFVRVARASKQFVVSISTTEMLRGWNLPHLGRFFAPWGERERGRNFLERFAPDFSARGQSQPRHSLGSGFIVDPKGYILTNYHVVERSGVIKVTLEDRSEYEARIVGTDPKTDIALLKIDAGRPLPTGRLGDSDRLEVGEWVMAIGSPFGLSHTVTVGVVSAKGRVIGSGPLDDYLQTDAYINVGNSGGPLLSAQGEVVGINTAIVAESLGVGFAIPINVVKAVLPDLRMYGSPRRGWLGLALQELTPALAKGLGLNGRDGAVVSEVTASSPAAVAGIRKGDVILEFNGRPVRAMRDLPKWVAAQRPGTRARLKLLRDGRPLEVAVHVSSADDAWETEEEAGRRLGLRVAPLTKHLASRMALESLSGVVVASVEEGSLAQAAGLQEGDVVLEIDRNPVHDLRAYRRLIRRSLEQESVLLLIRRNRNSIFVAVRSS